MAYSRRGLVCLSHMPISYLDHSPKYHRTYEWRSTNDMAPANVHTNASCSKLGYLVFISRVVARLQLSRSVEIRSILRVPSYNIWSPSQLPAYMALLSLSLSIVLFSNCWFFLFFLLLPLYISNPFSAAQTTSSRPTCGVTAASWESAWNEYINFTRTRNHQPQEQ